MFFLIILVKYQFRIKECFIIVYKECFTSRICCYVGFIIDLVVTNSLDRYYTANPRSSCDALFGIE